VTRVFSHLALMVKFTFGTNVSGDPRKRMMLIVLGEDNPASGSLFSQLEWKRQHGFFLMLSLFYNKKDKGIRCPQTARTHAVLLPRDLCPCHLAIGLLTRTSRNFTFQESNHEITLF
jgi:hypothetical protein